MFTIRVNSSIGNLYQREGPWQWYTQGGRGGEVRSVDRLLLTLDAVNQVKAHLHDDENATFSS